MVSSIVQYCLVALGLYLLVGVLVAFMVAIRGAGRLDPAADGATWGFRVIIMPGVIALWPLVMARWRQGGRILERNAHRDLAGKAGG